MRTLSKPRTLWAKLKRLLRLSLSQKETFFLKLGDAGYEPRVGIFIEPGFTGTEEQVYEEMNKVFDMILSGMLTPITSLDGDMTTQTVKEFCSEDTPNKTIH